MIEQLEKEQDISRLEKFKQWEKENFISFSALTISVAGVITTVIVRLRKAVVTTGQTVGRFVWALNNISKKLGPIIAPILTLLSTVVSWGTKGLSWLAT